MYGGHIIWVRVNMKSRLGCMGISLTLNQEAILVGSGASMGFHV